MLKVGAFEAKNRLSELLDKVADGEEVLITRRGLPAARLVAVAPTHDREAARRALDEIIEINRGTSLDSVTIRELIDEGRP